MRHGPCLCFTVWQKRPDNVLDLCPERIGGGWTCRNRLVATLYHQIVEIRVIAKQRQVHHARIETYLVDIGVEADLAAQELLDFAAVRTMMHEPCR